MIYGILCKMYFRRLPEGVLDSLFQKSFTRAANFILPFYFKGTLVFHSSRLKQQTHSPVLIVSLTTFPRRIHKVWLTIETLLRQDVKPDAIMLWLYRGEFPDKSTLPKQLLAQEKRGLQIKFCSENLMPHKKYYYTLQADPGATIITIDDDAFYPPDLIKRFMQNSKNHPNQVLCFRSRKISAEQGQFLPYYLWPNVRTNTEPMVNLLPLGTGGVLYPAGSLHREVLNIELIKKLALRADDVWLKVMGLLNETKVVCLGAEYPRYFISVRIKGDIKLADENVFEGRNDMMFKLIVDHFKLSMETFQQETPIRNI